MMCAITVIAEYSMAPYTAVLTTSIEGGPDAKGKDRHAEGEMSVGAKSIALAVALCAACLLSFAAADVNIPS